VIDFDYVVLVSEGDKDLLSSHIDSIRKTGGPESIFVVDKTDGGVAHGGAIRFPRYQVQSACSVPNHYYDVADSYEKAMECGEKPFCMVSHVDVKFQSPGIWEKIRSQSHDTAIIGDCRSLFVMNRASYKVAHFGFWSLHSLHGEKSGASVRIRICGQPISGEGVFVNGLDVGDLLLLEFAMFGFKCVSHNFWWKDYYHAGNGSRFVSDPKSTKHHEQRRKALHA